MRPIHCPVYRPARQWFDVHWSIVDVYEAFYKVSVPDEYIATGPLGIAIVYYTATVMSYHGLSIPRARYLDPALYSFRRLLTIVHSDDSDEDN